MPIDNPLPRTKKVLSHAGATGAILTTKLIHSMRRDGLKRGLVTLCIGGG